MIDFNTGMVLFYVVVLVLFGIGFLYLGVKTLHTNDGDKLIGTIIDLIGNGNRCKVSYTRPDTKIDTHTYITVDQKQCITGKNVTLEFNRQNGTASLFVENKSRGQLFIFLAAIFFLLATLLYKYRRSPIAQGLTFGALLFD
jgi:hypothetical protein